jgi:hypothetical protein
MPKQPTNVRNPEAFTARVNYAALCFMRGTISSRTFDTCFEMSDGDAVVTALIRRGEKNPKLKKAVSSIWNPNDLHESGWPNSWWEAAQKNADRKNLTELARELREESSRHFDEWQKRLKEAE